MRERRQDDPQADDRADEGREAPIGGTAGWCRRGYRSVQGRAGCADGSVSVAHQRQ